MQLWRERSKEPIEPTADSHKYGKRIKKECLVHPKGNRTSPNHPHNPDLKILWRHGSEGPKKWSPFPGPKTRTENVTTQCRSSPFAACFSPQNGLQKMPSSSKTRTESLKPTQPVELVELIIHDEQGHSTCAQSTQAGKRAGRQAGNQAREQASSSQAGMTHT